MPKSASAVCGVKELDQPGCAFMGTIVHQGSAQAVVVCTGAGTAFGKIAAGLAERPAQTAFEVGLSRFSRFLFAVAAVLTAFIFVDNVALSRPLIDALLFSLAILDTLFSSGARVGAVASRPAGCNTTIVAADEHGLTLAGFLTFADRPKADAGDAIAQLERLGVTVKIITGDNGLAAKVCADIGFACAGVLTGTDVEVLDDDDLESNRSARTVSSATNPLSEFQMRGSGVMGKGWCSSTSRRLRPRPLCPGGTDRPVTVRRLIFARDRGRGSIPVAMGLLADRRGDPRRP